MSGTGMMARPTQWWHWEHLVLRAMAKNRMQDLRDHLFETLEALKDQEKPLDVERAKAICQVSQQIIESAKTDVKYAQAIGALPDSAFFEAKPRLLTEAKPANGRAI